MTKYTILHKNGSLVDADCESKAVRIRDISEHSFWPNIPRTTLLFSENENYCDEASLENTGDINIFNFHKAVKPNFG